jgi:hypothetical protein
LFAVDERTVFDVAVDTRDSTARMKSLEIAVFPTVRSMRAVFCDAY